MKNQLLTGQFLNLAVKELGFSSVDKGQAYISRFLNGIPLKNTSVLDIGCGTGLMSIYSACEGASQVIGLEPEDAGSTNNTRSMFNQLAKSLNLSNAVCYPYTFQEYSPNGQLFDLILLHSSINHLDEAACINLKNDKKARDSYLAIFDKISKITKPGGKIVILDCSRHNFFGTLGVRNPMSPNIEWHKHQSPYLWASLLAQSGFTSPKVNWLVHAKLKNFETLLANQFCSFFMRSSFRLVMAKN